MLFIKRYKLTLKRAQQRKLSLKSFEIQKIARNSGRNQEIRSIVRGISEIREISNIFWPVTPLRISLFLNKQLDFCPALKVG